MEKCPLPRRRARLLALPQHKVRGLAPSALAVAAPPNALRPRGPASAEIAALWWVMFGVGMAVFVAVVVLVVVASVRRRPGDLADDTLAGEGFAAGSNLLVVGGGVVVPAIVVVGLMVATVTTSASVATVGDPVEPLVVEITGHQFWWDVRYPEQELRIANELHLPVGRPVDLRVTSADVIHSFWVPQLGGKIDVNPGNVNSLRLLANEPGVYRGLCGEYCGLQHARMQLIAVAHEPAGFEAWLQERAASPEDDERRGETAAGREVFLGAGCAECHTIEGVSPRNDRYPDLTHLADRRTIAAGALPNNRGNLGGWILDPQALKPGSHMPPANLTGEELQALLDYLETLE